MDIKGVLFDLDCVLIDSMEDLYLAWKNSFLRFGVEIKRGDYFPLEGTKVIEIAKIISKKYGINPDPAEIVKSKEEFYLKDHSLKFYPGVIEFIDKLLSKEIKMAMVSASTREKLNKTVPVEFLKKFNVIVSGDDTYKGKPDPEPYIKAMNSLSLKPEQCIVIENAPLGIKSAKAANLYCMAICSTLDKNFLKEADVIINKFEDLFDINLIKDL